MEHLHVVLLLLVIFVHPISDFHHLHRHVRYGRFRTGFTSTMFTHLRIQVNKRLAIDSKPTWEELLQAPRALHPPRETSSIPTSALQEGSSINELRRRSCKLRLTPTHKHAEQSAPPSSEPLNKAQKSQEGRTPGQAQGQAVAQAQQAQVRILPLLQVYNYHVFTS